MSFNHEACNGCHAQPWGSCIFHLVGNLELITKLKSASPPSCGARSQISWRFLEEDVFYSFRGVLDSQISILLRCFWTCAVPWYWLFQWSHRAGALWKTLEDIYHTLHISTHYTSCFRRKSRWSRQSLTCRYHDLWSVHDQTAKFWFRSALEAGKAGLARMNSTNDVTYRIIWVQQISSVHWFMLIGPKVYHYDRRARWAVRRLAFQDLISLNNLIQTQRTCWASCPALSPVQIRQGFSCIWSQSLRFVSICLPYIDGSFLWLVSLCAVRKSRSWMFQGPRLYLKQWSFSNSTLQLQGWSCPWSCRSERLGGSFGQIGGVDVVEICCQL